MIGKGILRFHAVYWPAFLASAGEPAPTRIQVHPYLTVDGAKLSKSSGVAVDPTEIVADYGADALRWWFARDVGLSADTDFTTARLVRGRTRTSRTDSAISSIESSRSSIAFDQVSFPIVLRARLGRGQVLRKRWPRRSRSSTTGLRPGAFAKPSAR